ncbi:MAG: nuclear transport factor 2 family protein, partial [Terriglobales bacterium]
MRRAGIVLWVLSLATLAAGQLQPQPCEQRPADRDAIRAHIESIFQAFIDHDGAKLRATHAPEWRGFLERSQTAIRGIDDYMKSVDGSTRPGPNGMKSYKITEFDCVLYGDTAIVPFVADVSGTWSGQQWNTTLRIVDFYAKLNGAWIQAGSDTQTHPKVLNARGAELQQLPEPVKQKLLAEREHVWKAYFSNERSYLEQALPQELIAIDPGGDWSTRETVLS